MLIAFYVSLSTLCSVFGQLTLKFAMQRIAADGGTATRERPLLLTMALSPWVIGGLFIYGCGVLFWLIALSRLEVSYVYPFASLSYVGIIIGSHLIFNEHILRTRLVGIAIIIFGVIIVGLSSSV